MNIYTLIQSIYWLSLPIFLRRCYTSPAISPICNTPSSNEPVYCTVEMPDYEEPDCSYESDILQEYESWREKQAKNGQMCFTNPLQKKI